MATISELNVRLGLLSRDFDRSLKQVEKGLRASAQKLQYIGNEMSLAVSLPLLALGKYAVQSAGDIESLRLALETTMLDGGRSIAEARAELEALRKSALAPGLDFEQAVKGSVRLQNVGFSAEKARFTIEQLANAIALTGGTADDLDEVVNQFTQMIGKGKLYQEDLRIITGRLPKLATIMKETFGATTAEGINATGISAKQFVDTIVTKMSELPRVAGGIKNSIVNLFAGIKLAAARIGDEINKAFNLSDLSDTIVNFINKVVDAFSGLSTGTKKFLVQGTLLIALLGPITRLFGAMFVGAYALIGPFKAVVQWVNAVVVAYRALNVANAAVVASQTAVPVATKAMQGLSAAGIAVSAGMQKATVSIGATSTATAAAAGTTGFLARAMVALNGFVAQTIAAFRALSIAQQAFIGIGIAVALYAAIQAFDVFNTRLTETEKLQKEIAESAAEEVSAMQRNIAVLSSAASSQQQRAKAIKDLTDAYPEYLKGINLEAQTSGQLLVIQRELNAEIIRGAAAKAKANAQADIAAEIIRKELELTALRRKKENGGTTAAFGFAGIDQAIKRNEDDLDRLKKKLEDVGKEFDNAFNLNGKAPTSVIEIVDPKGAKEGAAAVANIGKSAKETADAMKEAKKKTDLYKDALASIAAVAQKEDVLGADVIGEQAKEIESQIERLLENGFKPYSKEIQNLKKQLEGLRVPLPQGNTGPVTGTIPTIPAIGEFAPTVSMEGITSGQKTLEDFAAAAKKASESVVSSTQKMQQAYANFNLGLISTSELYSALIDNIQAKNAQGAETMQIFASGILSIGESIGQALGEGATAFAEFAKGIINSIADVISALIKQYVATLLAKSAFAAANPFAALAIGGAVGSLASGLFKRIVGAAKLAEGGVITKPTLALVGEYAGASTNPEIVTPESKLRSIFNESAGGGIGQLVATVKGDDLQFILDKAAQRRARIR